QFARLCGGCRFAALAAVGWTRSITSSTQAFAADQRSAPPQSSSEPRQPRLVVDATSAPGWSSARCARIPSRLARARTCRPSVAAGCRERGGETRTSNLMDRGQALADWSEIRQRYPREPNKSPRPLPQPNGYSPKAAGGGGSR